jgi:hypothetical protein
MLTKKPLLCSLGKSTQRLLKVPARIRRWKIIHRQHLSPHFLISFCLRARVVAFIE